MSNNNEKDKLVFDIATLLERLKKWIEEEYPLYTVGPSGDAKMIDEKSENSKRGQYLLESAKKIVDAGIKHKIDKKGNRYNYDCIGTVLFCIYRAGYLFDTNFEGISDYFDALNQDAWLLTEKNHFYNMLGMWDLRSCGEEKKNELYDAEPGDLLIWQKDHNGQATSHGHVIMYLGLDEDGFSIFLSGTTNGTPRIIEEADTDLPELFDKYDKKYPHFTKIKPALVREKG